MAGNLGEEYFIWDPDDSDAGVEEMLAGKVTLQTLFDYYLGQVIEFWEYKVVVVKC